MDNSKTEDNTEQLKKQKEEHMRLLHEYNMLKDATQTVLGVLAHAKGVSIKEMHKRYNLPSGD